MGMVYGNNEKTASKQSVGKGRTPGSVSVDSHNGLHTGPAELAEKINASPFMVRQEKQLPSLRPDVRQRKNETGIPDAVKEKMEQTFETDFSDVRVHKNSSSAPEAGALAYTQGTDIHFAPGQFNPDTSSGKSLIGHELTHVVQQNEGRVQPTTEINGMPVNDSPSLEDEADRMGRKASG